MNIEPTTPPVKNPPEQFIGDVWVDTIAAPHESDQRMVVASVKFAYGARTAWHCHARGQYLRVTAGVAWSGTGTATSSRSTQGRRCTPLRDRTTGTRRPPAV